MAPNRLSISALIDSQPATPSPAGRTEALPSLAEVTAGLSSPKHRHASVEDLGRHEHPSYYAAAASSSYYPPSTTSPHTPYAPNYASATHTYAYPPSHAPTYSRTPPSAYSSYERPYSRHSIHSQSSHSLSPELPTSLGVTGMKRKRSDEVVIDPMERERDMRVRYAYSDTRETYEPVPPPPRLSPSHPHPTMLPSMRGHSPAQAYGHPSPRERQMDVHYYAQSPQAHYPGHPTPHTPHTSTSGEYFARQSFGYQPAPVPAAYAYPPTQLTYVDPPVERVSPRTDPHYATDPHYVSQAQQPAVQPPYRSPTSSYSFAPSHHSHHSQSPYDSRPTSGNKEPVIATAYAVPRTETSPVVEMVQREEEERRAHSRQGWKSRGIAHILDDTPTPTSRALEEPSRPEPSRPVEGVKQVEEGVHYDDYPMAEEIAISEAPPVASGVAKSEEAHPIDQPVDAETLAGAVVESPAPEQVLAPTVAEETKPDVQELRESIAKPQLVVEVDVKPEPASDMDIDIVSQSPAATVSVAHPTPVDGHLPVAERSPSLASTVPMAPEVIEPSPAPTIRRASTLPDGDHSPAPTILRVEPSPAPTVLRESTKEEPASPVLNVDVLSPPVPSGIRQPSGAPRTAGNEVHVPESTQLTNLVDAAFGPATKSETPAATGKDDVDVDVVEVPEATPDPGRGASILSETTNTALDKASAAKSKSHKAKSKSHKASPTVPKTDVKAKSKAKDSAKATTAKEAARARPKDASPTPASKSKSKKSHSKQVARVRSPEPVEDTPEPAKADEEEDKEKDDRLYCMCETLYDEERFMIGCDKCDNWYHPACVGLEEEAADLIDKFFCPRCIAADTSLNTTHKRPCARFPSCTNPSRLPSSKYCSDECGQARVEEIYNMQPKAVQDLIKKAVQGARRPEGRVDPITGRVHGRGKGEDAQLGKLEESLQGVLDERAESEGRLEMWERRERVVEAIVNRWKHELKEDGICGYDDRLGYGWDELDSVDPSEPGADVCQEGLKCDRHRGWQQAHMEGVQRAKALEEENLQDLTLRERGLRREMEIIEAKRKVVQRTWRKVPDTVPVTALAESAGLTNELPEVIDVKVEV